MKHFRNILYVSEPLVDQASALARAVSLAARHEAKLTIVSTVSKIEPEYLDEEVAFQRQALQDLAVPHGQNPNIQTDVLVGSAFREIIRAVLRHGYDLVIKAAENPGFLQRLFGSTDMHLLRKCPCPVWLMKVPETPHYSQILAAVDVNPVRSDETETTLNSEILALASALAVSDGAALHLVHAWEGFAEGIVRRWSDKSPDEVATYVEMERQRHQSGLSSLEDSLQKQVGEEIYSQLRPRYHLQKGAPQREISAMAEKLQADLVVMGTLARTGVSGLFIGNTAEMILEQLPCSVLAIKPPGFISPVKLDE
ncbi:universal stress protein [Desulfuromonas sp. AOP6]|uniref:universal stress protein n=1 Tax=Desulfuromonas sp. AOP6 TaxID=1566351 RepID=UPI001283CE12|nr:universal stress protein [Desulfuromonas sp. AOP6]BCA78862.1 universal stress protein [Desulfuromonas sp. AOP6]